MTGSREIRKCNECGEEWTDAGTLECPFCGSSNTAIVNDERADEQNGDNAHG